jgi:hypothetical protein
MTELLRRLAEAEPGNFFFADDGVFTIRMEDGHYPISGCLHSDITAQYAILTAIGYTMYPLKAMDGKLWYGGWENMYEEHGYVKDSDGISKKYPKPQDTFKPTFEAAVNHYLEAKAPKRFESIQEANKYYLGDFSSLEPQAEHTNGKD